MSAYFDTARGRLPWTSALKFLNPEFPEFGNAKKKIADNARRRQLARRGGGYQSTILSGSLGDRSGVTLLGGKVR